MLKSAKLWEVWYNMRVYLRAKFEVPSVILTSFRQGGEGGWVILPPTTSKRTPKKSTQIRVNLKNLRNYQTFYTNIKCVLVSKELQYQKSVI